MDRHRFDKRSRELRQGAKLLADLARMPDRATPKDFSQAAGLMTDAASDLDELRKAQPIGCICPRIEDDNYNYVDYVESCPHHGQFYRLRESLKADYEKLEKALKNDVRLRLVAAALSGIAAQPDNHEVFARSAIATADEVLRQIIKAAK